MHEMTNPVEVQFHVHCYLPIECGMQYSCANNDVIKCIQCYWKHIKKKKYDQTTIRMWCNENFHRHTKWIVIMVVSFDFHFHPMNWIGLLVNTSVGQWIDMNPSHAVIHSRWAINNNENKMWHAVLWMCQWYLRRIT